jgi:NSS family neurotransmitter:Na+ symporter
MSFVIIFNQESMFDFVAALATKYGQPIIAMLCCVFVGWIWQRNGLIAEIKQGNENVENTLFWKIWPWYTKFVCPLAIAAVFIHSMQIEILNELINQIVAIANEFVNSLF